MEPIKVLQVNAGSGNFGGVSAMILNIYKHIDRKRIQFDFLTPNKTTYELYRSEIESMGGNIFEFGIDSSTFIGKIRLIKQLKHFLKENQYDVIHVNSGVLFFNCVVSGACHRYCRAKIIVHSHNNGGRKKWKDSLSFPLKMYLEKQADLILACSASAARYMFTEKGAEKAIVIKNGINAERFGYNDTARKKARQKWNISDKYVIGNVGRFMPQKNHTFMIEVLGEVVKKEPDAVLMLIGQGELLLSVKEKVHEKKLEENVLFLGQQKEVDRLYQAMDVFFLPSIFEGFGIVNLEAQASGLVCITSDQIPVEVDATNLVKRLSLDAPAEVWAEALLESRTCVRRDLSKHIADAGYDIKSTGRFMETLYCRIVET